MISTAPQSCDHAKWFATTHWSVVLSAAQAPNTDSHQALELLCRAYWYPLYVYVRRQGYPAEEAQDLTQEFFTQFLERKSIQYADPVRGRFRTFLLTAMKNFLANEWKKSTRQKRGGGQCLVVWSEEKAEQRYAMEAVNQLTPERIYEKRWAATLLERVLERLGTEYATIGKGALFAELRAFIWGDKIGGTYNDISRQLGISEGAVKVSVHRMRQRYREFLRREIADTVSSESDIDEELHYLIKVFSR